MKSHPLFEKLRIFAPGPTPVPDLVLAEMARSPLHHRTKEFVEILTRVKSGLQYLFQTQQPAYVLSSSGTGAMETVIVNLFATGDEVIVVDGGKFGERWAKLAAKFGLTVHTIKVEWGNAVSPDEIVKTLKAHPKSRAVLFQASETSTGVYHPVKEIAEVVHKNSDALVIVDAITALGVVDLPMETWGLDAVVSGSQKALMLPPGLSFLALSERAHEQRKRSNIPNFYFNLNAEDKAAVGGETAWTPAVSLICGLDVVLTQLKKSGLEPVFNHHARLAEGTRRGVKGMGLELFAKTSPSNSVTAVHVPKEITEGKKVVSYLRDQFGVTIAGGQDQWKGKIFRIAHLGFYDELDMLTILSAIENTLKALGAKIDLGKGVATASQYFLESRNHGK
jgi:aspartate aminotransferase-like enzyme